jgi:cytochrome b561
MAPFLCLFVAKVARTAHRQQRKPATHSNTGLMVLSIMCARARVNLTLPVPIVFFSPCNWIFYLYQKTLMGIPSSFLSRI